MNILKKRLFLCYALLFFSLFSFAQLNLDNITLVNSGFGYFHPTQINTACSGPVSLTNGSGAYRLVSGNEIRLCPGFSASAPTGTTGFFHANVKNQLLDATILEPAIPTAVGKYEKLELGINLPSQIDDRIIAYLDDEEGPYKAGTAAYTNALNNGEIINPYDPEHISVDVVFFKPSSPNSDGVIRHGFYYKKFNDSGTDDWIKASDPYEWRVRFAPDEEGTWNAYVNVYVNGILQSQNYFFSFTVVGSDRKGFVKVGPNHRFLQYDNGELYFAAGDNYSFPTSQVSNPIGNCHTINCADLYNSEGVGHDQDHRITRKYREEAFKYLDKLSNNGEGGNFTRVILSPWGLEIEWERLGNYNSRQIEMTELDNFFEHAEEVGVGVELTTLLHVEVDPLPTFWNKPWYYDQWEFNPYNGTTYPSDYTSHPSGYVYPAGTVNDPLKPYKGIAGLTNHLDFFSNATAKKFFKNKLRYISSRWGYSTSFIIHELMSEVDQMAYADDFWSTPGHPAIVENWLDEMGGYLKNELHDRQLTTASYLGDGYRRDIGGPLTNLWGKPNIDIISGHNYSANLRSLRTRAAQTNAVAASYNKPAMFNENDFQKYEFVNACTNTFMHNLIWSSAFSGAFGSGMLEEARIYLIDDWHNTPGMDIENQYGGVRRFFGDVDLLSQSYTFYQNINSSTSGEGPFENIYMVPSDKLSAYGWFHNRSVNPYTHQGSCMYIDTDNSDNYTQIYNTMPELMDGLVIDATPSFLENMFIANAYSENYNTYFPIYPYLISNPYPEYPLSGGSGDFLIQHLLPNENYRIQYYWTEGASIGTAAPYLDQYFTTDNVGNAYITGGPGTGGWLVGDWAYKVNKVHMRKAAPGAFNENKVQDYTIQPNPSNGVFTLKGDRLLQAESIAVYDLYGKKLLSLQASQDKNLDIDLSVFSSGMYILKITFGNEVITKQLIKQ